MLFRKLATTCALISTCLTLNALELPEEILAVMHQDKYKHGTWGLYAKDLETGEVLFELNAQQMFIPASTTKLFTMAALLHAYGEDFRFKTPVYAVGEINAGVLQGDLILIGQGDLTFGGRQNNPDEIEFTKLDHIIANDIPGVILTPQDPLKGILDLARQVRDKGIKEINGDILIDGRLFEKTEKRGLVLSPIFINENLIDIVINPTALDKRANISWRPQAPGYTVTNEVTTVSKDAELDIQISADEPGRKIVVKGTVPMGQKDLVRTYPIKDPSHFAQAAFVQALKMQGIAVNPPKKTAELPSETALNDLQPVAIWTSPPLSEYAKLILKVSQNVGADLAPLLLAANKGGKTFDQGMLLLGSYITDVTKIPSENFVFIDAAGGDQNRLTPKATGQLLEYMKSHSDKRFKAYFNALPILGIDGSLADFAKNTAAAGKVRAKTGTGILFNQANQKFFLTCQALAGYIEGKNGHMLAYAVVVNNGRMDTLEEIFPIFEDLSRISAALYDLSVRP